MICDARVGDVETITLADLAPIIAAVLGPMLVFAAATMRYQHLDSTKTRDLIDKNRELSEQAHKETRDLIDKNRELSEQAHKETRDLIDKNRELSEQAHKETRDLIDKNRELSEQAHKETREVMDRNHRELSVSLGDARERLSRMEGYLRALAPPPNNAADGDAEAA